MNVINSTLEKRWVIYRTLLEVNDYDMGHDWFQSIYEAELSEGKRKGQHFTPDSIPRLLSCLTDAGSYAGSVHEPTAGTGSLIIGDWWNHTSRLFPWEVNPKSRKYTVWELSERALPLLLINLSIRGINAHVFHGDVLEQTVKAEYLVVNNSNDALGFSDIIVCNPVKTATL